jgi:hypothetical protein
MINWKQRYSKIPTARIVVKYTITPDAIVNCLCAWMESRWEDMGEELPKLAASRIEMIVRDMYGNHGACCIEDGWADDISPADREEITSWARRSVRDAWPQAVTEQKS